MLASHPNAPNHGCGVIWKQRLKRCKEMAGPRGIGGNCGKPAHINYFRGVPCSDRVPASPVTTKPEWSVPSGQSAGRTELNLSSMRPESSIPKCEKVAR